MNREDSLLSMLDAAAKIQFQVADILESKALESEKSRAWICGHIRNSSFALYADQLKKSLEMHDQLIEVIDGLTKMENGLSKNLGIILNRNDDKQEGFGGLGDLFGGGGIST